MVLLKENLEKKLSASETTVSRYRRKKNSPFLESKVPKSLKWFFVLFIFCTLAAGGFLYSKMHKMKKKERKLSLTVKELQYKRVTADCLGGIPIPTHLVNIPFGDDTGLVLGVQSVDIRNVIAPHNPTLIKSSSGYDLFFRYDLTSSKARHLPYFSHIGVVSLDEKFSQGKEEFKKIELSNDYTEDPRALFVGDQLFLVYNALDLEALKGRTMCLANIDPSTHRTNYTTCIDMNLSKVEKNWPPFAYENKSEDPKLFFEYQITPRKIVWLPDPQKNEMQNMILPRNVAYMSLFWEKIWGHIRGGTPALKIGDEYLAFFHSAFSERGGFWWYVMGAYTFQATPPFALTGISRQPILFRGIFDTSIANTAEVRKRVIFPSGFVIEKQDGKEIIQLACGENDSGIKIVTLDKEVLLNSLERFKKE